MKIPVDDPEHVAELVVREVLSLGDRPLLTVAGLAGVSYEPVNYLIPVEYAVRWGGFVLEYGSHYVSDQKGLIQSFKLLFVFCSSLCC